MIFLAYSPLKDQSIAQSLGVSDYSYYFVMKRFEPLLSRLGDFRVLDDIPDDGMIERIQDEGPCVLFCFTPPHRLPKLTRCPVIPVFAWEFSTIPYESFGQPDDNWAMCLERAGQAITHSSYAKQVVQEQLGQDYKIVSIPAPLWDSYEAIRQVRAGQQPGGLEALHLKCTIIDSADYEITDTLIKPAKSAQRGRLSIGEVWNGEPLECRFGCNDERPGMVGFNTPEDWGCWSKSGYPWILLNEMVSGPIEMTVSVRGYAQHIGRHLTIRMGDASGSVLLDAEMQSHKLQLDVTQPTNFISFEGISKPVTDAEDPRDLAVGFMKLNIRRPENSNLTGQLQMEARGTNDASPNPSTTIQGKASIIQVTSLSSLERDCEPDKPVSGPVPPETILYTSILNPQDGRKNWEDIITSFVYAFRDCPECILLIKITNQQIGPILEDIFKFFMQLSPFKCRLVFLHGYLNDNEFEKLIINSHFVVNASRGEGQCLPLMEFMSSGVPAIAPTNSAMRDYMHEGAGFVVASSPELTFWPHDPRQPYRTYWDRINWESLRDALKQSHQLVLKDFSGYLAMCEAAIEAQRKYCSMEVGHARLKSFLKSFVN